MKPSIFVFLAFLMLNCQKDTVVNNNPYLPNYNFSFIINTSLPLYNSLQFPGNPILITSAGAGLKGIIVMNAGVNDYRAFEASCPNQYPSNCSQLIINGINAKCPCDDKEYSLYTGLGTGVLYPLKQYRVEVVGANLRVYN
ncbi:hypothetical protein [Flavobacterium sp.]|uniref:hypothetical protein n=1 Tax=Flavobacterium sp. TaxID=239 RepID=UPI00286E231A|nr:hypothetical protein [Flavobacterium sp.]